MYIYLLILYFILFYLFVLTYDKHINKSNDKIKLHSLKAYQIRKNKMNMQVLFMMKYSFLSFFIYNFI